MVPTAGGGAVEGIEEFLKEAGITLAAESLKVQWAPDPDFLAKCREWGKELAANI